MSQVATQDVKIEISNLSKIFGPKPKMILQYAKDGMSKEDILEKHQHVLGLNNINLKLETGNVECIMGLSGSGKSTLIRHINRLIEPTDGSIIIDGKDVTQMNREQLRLFRQQKTAMVFQSFALLPHKTVMDNVCYGINLQGITGSKAEKQAQKWIERVSLTGFENRYPSQLSGGMQQRVGLARALTCDTEILMMDEAFSALDPLIRSDMQDLLLQLQQELHKTIVFITHDLDEALKIGDKIAILNGGILIQHGSPQQILVKPADNYVADFVRKVSRVHVLYAKSVMTTKKPGGNKIIDINVKDVIDDALSNILRTDINNYAMVKDDDGKEVGYLTENIIADILKPLKVQSENK